MCLWWRCQAHGKANGKANIGGQCHQCTILLKQLPTNLRPLCRSDMVTSDGLEHEK